MNLANVMDQIAARLRTIPSLNVYEYPADKISPDAAVIDYPDDYTFDESYARGLDSMMLPLWIVTGKVSAKATKARVTAYCNGTGPRSIKEVVESGTYTAFDHVTVKGIKFDIVTIASTDYLAAQFVLSIFGSGA